MPPVAPPMPPLPPAALGVKRHSFLSVHNCLDMFQYSQTSISYSMRLLHTTRKKRAGGLRVRPSVLIGYIKVSPGYLEM
jgi:hypothetical protein